MTSSTDAITNGHPAGQVLTEADWSDLAACGPYQKSKVLAERAARDLARRSGLELVTINPGLVLGPLQRSARTTSAETVRLLLAREVPAIPRIGFSIVDVRDVARAHRLATELPAAAGNRYVCAGEFRWMGEIAAVLAETYRPRGYRVPTRPLPYWLMWAIARVDPTVRLALGIVGREARVSSAKAAAELGWTPRPAAESILVTAESLLAFGLVARSAADRQSGQAARVTTG
jgi:dihydroflavonol-4-reductase